MTIPATIPGRQPFGFLGRHRFPPASVAAAAAWGTATVISKRAVAELPPLVLLPIQLGASVLALTTATLTGRRARGETARLGAIAWLGVLNPGLSYALGLIGLAQISASTSVLLWAQSLW